MLYLVGLGLGDHRDITVRGLEAVRSCDKVFLENYTSILGVDKAKLEEFYERPIVVADRELVESAAETILEAAKSGDAALLVVGDPFGATTHADLVVRAREDGIRVETIHNASIMNAVACTGLQLYRFGYTVSIPFFRPEWRPQSFYPRIRHNQAGGLHTLCLVDIKVKEPDFDALRRGRRAFLPPRYMTVAQAASQLLEVEADRGDGVCGGSRLGVGLARVGQPSQEIVYGPLSELAEADLGEPLHSLVVAGDLHDMEAEMLRHLGKPTAGGEEALRAAVTEAQEKERLTAAKAAEEAEAAEAADQ